MGQRTRFALVAMVAALSCAPVRAAISSDGSLGAKGAIAGPSYSIPASRGKVVGSNLFHSFSTFDLDKGETATFTGPPSVKSVLTRVTGGASNIDGTIRCTIPGASFYLINPRGVVFGPDAKLDVQGSFAVTTADELKLGAGGKFSASLANESVLTTSAPARFGFLAAPAAITINGANLAAPKAAHLIVAGGPVRASNASLSAPAGHISVLSSASAGQAALDAAHDNDLLPSVPAEASVVMDRTTFSADGEGAGRIDVHCGGLMMNRSQITAQTNGAAASHGIALNLSGNLQADNSLIDASSNAAGAAGDVHLRIVGDLSMDKSDPTIPSTGIQSQSRDALHGGNTGNITVDSNSLHLHGGEGISITTFGPGAGGDINIRSGTVTLDGDADTSSAATGLFARTRSSTFAADGGNISITAQRLKVNHGADIDADTFGLGNGGNVEISSQASIQILDTSQVHCDTYGTGNAGSVSVASAAIRIDGGSFISSDSLGSGAAGGVQIHGGSLHLQGQDADDNPSYISSDSGDEDTVGGPAGGVVVHVGVLQLNGAAISSDAYHLSAGGRVFVKADSISMDGGDSDNFTGISSESVSETKGGPAGSVTVHANSLTILNTADIDSDTDGDGAAGNVNVRAKTLVADGFADSEDFTGISSDSTSETAKGPAGSVSVHADTLTLVRGGEITSDTYGLGRAGAVNVRAKSLLIDAQNSEAATDISSDSLSEGPGGSAGAVNVHANALALIRGGEISSDTSGDGRAGNVTVTASNLTVGNSHTKNVTDISSDCLSAGGPAGAVSVSADNLSILHRGSIQSTTSGAGTGGDITINAKSITIDSMGSSGSTAVDVSADSGSSGAAGRIVLTTDSLLIRNGGLVRSDTFALGDGGDIFISAQSLLIDRADSPSVTGIAASGERAASGNAGTISVQANELRIMNGGVIVSDAFGLGTGGNVRVAAQSLLIDGQTARFFTGISTDADPGATGAAGDIDLNAHDLVVRRGGRISSVTYGPGPGGNIVITSNALHADGAGLGTVTGINASTEQSATGDAGTIAIHSDLLDVRNHAQIFSDTFGKGSGGDLSITSRSLSIDGENSGSFTGIAASSEQTASGAAGQITLNTDHLSLVSAGEITSSTFGPGNAGTVSINATDLSASGGGRIPTAVLVKSYATGADGGDAGALIVHARDVSLLAGSYLSTSTDGGGKGGNLRVFADRFTSSGTDSFGSAGAFSASNNSRLRHAGNAGNIELHASDVLLSGDAVASAETTGSGRGGDVSFFADQVRFSGGSEMRAASTGRGFAGDLLFHVGQLDLNDVNILTLSRRTSGGNVVVHASDRVSLLNSQISTSARGNGGNITIDPLAVALNHSRILAKAVNGNGGNIGIVSEAFLQSPDSIINASSQFGLSGTIAISSPNADVTAGLAQLSGALAQQIGLQETCTIRTRGDFSSFVVEGTGGLPPEPDAPARTLPLVQPATHPAVDAP